MSRAFRRQICADSLTEFGLSTFFDLLVLYIFLLFKLSYTEQRNFILNIQKISTIFSYIYVLSMYLYFEKMYSVLDSQTQNFIKKTENFQTDQICLKINRKSVFQVVLIAYKYAVKNQ